MKGSVKRVLLQLTAGGGTTGWGEAAFAAPGTYLRPVILGAPVRRVRALAAAMDRAMVGHEEGEGAHARGALKPPAPCGSVAGTV